MKLAIVTRFPEDPRRPCGGVESVSVNLVNALRGIPDLDIHIVTMYPEFQKVGREDWNGVTVHRLAWTGGKILSHVRGAGRREMQAYLRQLAPDVVHAHDSMFGMTVMGLEIPRVLTIHGFVHADTRLQKNFPRLRSWIWKRAEHACWADQPHIISISPYVRERLGGIATGVIHDIDNPISGEFFGLSRRERPGRIFCAARLSYRKNILGLVQAFALLAKDGFGGELRVAGSSHDKAYLDSIHQFIRDNGLQDRVHILGRLGYEDVKKELCEASVFCLVSLEENSPMAVEEAMAVGVPVVTSSRCGMPYMVRDGESGFLVDPLNTRDIAVKLQRMLENPELREAMSRKSREIAEDRFHPRAIARRTYEVYKEALGQ